MLAFWRTKPKDGFDWPFIKKAVRSSFLLNMLLLSVVMIIIELVAHPEIDFWISWFWSPMIAAGFSLLIGMHLALMQAAEIVFRTIRQKREESWQEEWTDTD